MRGFEPRTSCSQSRRANQAALHPVNLVFKPAFNAYSFREAAWTTILQWITFLADAFSRAPTTPGSAQEKVTSMGQVTAQA
jgi:hypothetical protein